MATFNRRSTPRESAEKYQLYYYDKNQLQECNGDYGLCDMKFVSLFEITNRVSQRNSGHFSTRTVERPTIVMPSYIEEHRLLPGHSKPKNVLWKLGQGSFGQVYKGQYEGRDVAIKIFGSDTERKSEARKCNMVNHKSFRDVVRKVQKDKIIEQKKVFPKLLAMTEIPGQKLFCLVYELVQGVTMHSFFGRVEYQNSMYVYLNVFKEFALSLQHVHDTCAMRHRDIKADNVMVHHDKSKGEVQVFLFPWHLSLRFTRTNYIVHWHLHDEGDNP